MENRKEGFYIESILDINYCKVCVLSVKGGCGFRLGVGESIVE